MHVYKRQRPPLLLSCTSPSSTVLSCASAEPTNSPSDPQCFLLRVPASSSSSFCACPLSFSPSLLLLNASLMLIFQNASSIPRQYMTFRFTRPSLFHSPRAKMTMAALLSRRSWYTLSPKAMAPPLWVRARYMICITSQTDLGYSTLHSSFLHLQQRCHKLHCCCCRKTIR